MSHFSEFFQILGLILFKVMPAASEIAWILMMLDNHEQQVFWRCSLWYQSQLINVPLHFQYGLAKYRRKCENQAESTIPTTWIDVWKEGRKVLLHSMVQVLNSESYVCLLPVDRYCTPPEPVHSTIANDEWRTRISSVGTKAITSIIELRMMLQCRGWVSCTI